MVINVPSKLYRYIIYTKLQRSADSIFCVANFVFFRASHKKKPLFMKENCKLVTLISLSVLIHFSRGMVCKLLRSFFG